MSKQVDTGYEFFKPRLMNQRFLERHEEQLIEASQLEKRPKESTGVDIALNPGVDLMVTDQGDLKLISGVLSVQESVARRMTTPPDGYKRWVAVGENWIELDANYGNPVYYYLSTYEQNLGESVLEEVKQAIELEKRIVADVEIKESPRGNKIVLDLEVWYRIKSEQELYQLNVTLDRTITAPEESNV